MKQSDLYRVPPTKSTTSQRVTLIIVLIVHATLLMIQGLQNSPNIDEVGHLPAGLSHWQFGRFALYRVNPPLIRMIATIPLLVDPPKTDWSAYRDTLTSRAEWPVGHDIIRANGFDVFWYFTLARWMLIPISLMGAVVSYKWAKQLFGPRSGMIAATMYCFCPNLLAWGASITPDAGAAAFGVLASWLCWKWLRDPSYSRAIQAGLGLGLVELVKSSWVLLFFVWPILWAVWRFCGADTKRRASLHQLVLVMVTGVYVLNLGYGFEGSFQSLGKFTFVSKTLGGTGVGPRGGNRFHGTPLEFLPVPLPENYVRGVDSQKRLFEKTKWSYLRGEQKKGGWWYYYLYAILVKTPIGFLGLLALSIAAFVNHRCRAAWKDEVTLIVPCLLILGLVSSHTGINHHLRYVLPALPYLYVFASRVAVTQLLSARFMICGLLTAGTVSSLAVAPHCMSYFNVVAGGPVGGKYHLLDSNIDWGQDVLGLSKWQKRHHNAKPMFCEIYTRIDLSIFQIDALPIPIVKADDGTRVPDLVPGWYAISANDLMGYKCYQRDKIQCEPFRKIVPTDMVGYSIYIYHLTQADISLLNLGTVR